jgi:hypothetical protein
MAGARRYRARRGSRGREEAALENSIDPSGL